ncbi:ribonuclease E inhibitor RraB [Solilutibacter tolerans]|uniref:Regulator of ribonuclease activity B n=1 Tax=Solilutibacter tolerans TaxID=1604334 RepID=A0A1N6YN36_9GAMM|nr:ribonuclease E inhibitor RraB [Lysobacter tolerans]SIR16023.1 Regulator of ribonuclease activity B [Lysobacter tolerans]
MTVADKLMEIAARDTDLLLSLDEKGDQFYVPRDVEFFFWAADKQKADSLAGFVNDNRYGKATSNETDGQHSVLVVVNMPIQQNEVLSVSAFMACLGELYGLDYDGWGCVIQSQPHT